MTVFTTVRIAAVSIAALATFGIVNAASAEPSAAAAATASTASTGGSDYSAPAREMKYCVSTPVTGSRIPQRDCKTKAEWAAEGVTVELKKSHH
jgi:hypothetical protein